MGIRDFLRKDVDQGVFALDAAGEREVRQFRAGEKFRLIFALMQNNLLHVVERHAEPRVHLVRFFEAEFDQFGADEFADQRAGQNADVEADDLLFDLIADDFGGASVEIRFADQRVDDALFIPLFKVLARCSDVELGRHKFL